MTTPAAVTSPNVVSAQNPAAPSAGSAPAIGLDPSLDSHVVYVTIGLSEDTVLTELTIANLIVLPGLTMNPFAMFSIVCVDEITFDAQPLSAGDGMGCVIVPSERRIRNLRDLAKSPNSVIVVGTASTLANTSNVMKLPQGSVEQIVPVSTNGRPWKIVVAPVLSNNPKFVGSINLKLRCYGPLHCFADIPNI